MDVLQITHILEKKIDYHDQKYWKENNPEIPDSEYDKLIEKLKEIDPENPRLHKINSYYTDSDTIHHEVPMLSLAKVYSVEELLEWCASIARSENEIFRIEPKFDGWSASYKNRILATRGDGNYGENISSKITLINIVNKHGTQPLKGFNDDFIGEVILTKSNFQKYQQYLRRKTGDPYKTPRSALTGLLSSKEINSNFPSFLSLVDYESFYSTSTFKEMYSLDWKKLIEEYQNWDYPTDGLVIKLYDQEYSKSLGFTAHHPKGQIALKYGNPSGKTEIIGVNWFVGKNNTINPVALLKPVIIHGHEIKKANLHNAKNIIDIDIHIGDEVIVERCGEIIPDIVKVIPGKNRKEICIEKCPICGSDVIYMEPFLYCSNDDCDGSLSKKFTDSCKRLGIENIGQGTINKLIKIGIKDLYDLLTAKQNDFLCLDGFAETSAFNLYNEIYKVRSSEIDDWAFLSSLNINGIGKSISQSIMSVTTLQNLRQMEPEEIIKIPMIGSERSDELYIELDSMSEYIDSLLSILKIKQTFGQIKNSKGSICFTGKMDKPRSYYEDLATKNGYTPSDRVGSDLTYLVCQDVSSTKGKMTKARKLGIKIITIQEFLNLISK